MGLRQTKREPGALPGHSFLVSRGIGRGKE